MFTVEFDYEDIEITIMDNYGLYEDIKINAFEEVVFIRQWNEELERHNAIVISPEMWEDLIAAMNKPEGVFSD